MSQKKWDTRFLNLADFVSTWSKDPSTKVGSVITDEYNRIVSVGYNGFPRGIDDDARLKNREEKYKMIVHAEMNAILTAARDLSGCTIYTTPFLPCSNCATHIIQAGIKRVVAPINKEPRWEENLKLSESILKEAELSVITYLHTRKK